MAGTVMNPGPVLGVFTSASAGGTPTLVQSSCTAAVITSVWSATMTVTAGNTLAFLNVDTSEGYNSAVDSKGNVYTDWTAGGIGNGSARAIIYVSTNIASGGSTAMTIKASGGTMNGCVAEISGVTAFDVQKTRSATSTNATSQAYTTAGSTDLCLAIMSHSSSGTTLTPSGTQIGEDENNTTHQTYNAQYTTPAAGSNSSTWTNSSVAYVIAVVCLK